MRVHQVAVKMFVKDSEKVVQEQFIPVFHAWIRDGRINNKLLIDVADYRHVHHGPGVMLIANECHYAMDECQGNVGLLYTRKRDDLGDAEAKLTEAISDTLEACRALETDSALGGSIQFESGMLQVRMMSRLVASNDAAGAASLEPALNSVLGRIYPDGFTLTQSGESNGPLQIDVNAASTEDLDTLIGRIKS